MNGARHPECEAFVQRMRALDPPLPFALLARLTGLSKTTMISYARGYHGQQAGEAANLRALADVIASHHEPLVVDGSQMPEHGRELLRYLGVVVE